MLEFNTENQGAKVIINPAPYKNAVALKNVILKEIIKNPLGLKLKGEGVTALEKEVDISDLLDYLKNTIIGIEISDEFNSVIFECLSKCTYNMHRITEDLLDEIPEAREDIYEIKFKCVEENLRPFIKSLASRWKTLAPKIGESQALNLILAQMSK